LAFYRFWLRRVAPPPEAGPATHSASAGNRDLGNMRDLYRRYFAHLGEEQKGTPFDDLRFSERGVRAAASNAVGGSRYREAEIVSSWPAGRSRRTDLQTGLSWRDAFSFIERPRLRSC
jgi:hypothetical protein